MSKDGAELPPAQTAPRVARQVISVGETYDFEYEPSAPGEMRLEIMKRSADPILTSIRVRVAR